MHAGRRGRIGSCPPPAFRLACRGRAGFYPRASTAGAALRTANKQNGTITVQTKDGKIETLDCENGTCTTSSGVKITSENCESCTVK